MGICGGYQMLGDTLSDPHHVEAGGEIRGMGLLPMDTVFEQQKNKNPDDRKLSSDAGYLGDFLYRI